MDDSGGIDRTCPHELALTDNELSRCDVEEDTADRLAAAE
jgi:hypothetical protein